MFVVYLTKQDKLEKLKDAFKKRFVKRCWSIFLQKKFSLKFQI